MIHSVRECFDLLFLAGRVVEVDLDNENASIKKAENSCLGFFKN